MDSSPTDSSVHEVSQARILEWVAILFLHGALSDPEIEPRAPALVNGFLTTESPGKPFQNNKLACILKFLLVYSVNCLFAFSDSLRDGLIWIFRAGICSRYFWES